MTPTQRTLALLREKGYLCGIVEKWNPHAKIRQDLFGFIAIVALNPGIGIVGVQTTSGSNMSPRQQKITSSEEARDWSEAGGNIWLIGWRKVGARGKRKLWAPRIVEFQYMTGEGGRGERPEDGGWAVSEIEEAML